ncbi:hypothetical protein J7337_002096 [Fusarium musae]|uniref:NAD-dependent epimerase/dehydratase domain-containing protein n=1 Tax=Fusarium musae TaxID=1042133 RepID=A0A9P8ITS3_9HYPO|nr:hypothetical protein J7337_002096 [Fusarium musae]KAG9505130.1 hypothetical protein J7337_002096 [Fusarium musae]
MGSALVAAGGNRALGKLGYEDDEPDMSYPFAAARGASEKVCLEFAKQGVRASVVRLPPTTHGPGVSGFMGPFVNVALEKGVSAYVGDGKNHWCAAHRDDAARLYRLAIEKAEAGSIFHAVAEEGVTVKDIATEVGKQLNIPILSISPEKVPEHFGWFQFGAMADNTASSARTKEVLGWNLTGPTVLEDIEAVVDFVKSHSGQW